MLNLTIMMLFNHSVVTIPEDLPLSDSEVSVLSKGLNFVPVAKKSDEFQVKKDAESYFPPYSP